MGPHLTSNARALQHLIKLRLSGSPPDRPEPEGPFTDSQEQEAYDLLQVVKAFVANRTLSPVYRLSSPNPIGYSSLDDALAVGGFDVTALFGSFNQLTKHTYLGQNIIGNQSYLDLNGFSGTLGNGALVESLNIYDGPGNIANGPGLIIDTSGAYPVQYISGSINAHIDLTAYQSFSSVTFSGTILKLLPSFTSPYGIEGQGVIIFTAGSFISGAPIDPRIDIQYK